MKSRKSCLERRRKMKPNLSDIFTSQDKKTLLQLLKALVQAVDNIDYQEPILDENGNEIPKEWFSEMYDKIKVANNEVQVDVTDPEGNAYFIPISNGFKLNYPQNNLSYYLHIYPEDGYMSLNYSDASTTEEQSASEFFPNSFINDSSFSPNEFHVNLYEDPFATPHKYVGEWDFNKGTLAWRLPDTSKYSLGLTRANENALDITYSKRNTQKSFSIYKNELINDTNFLPRQFRFNIYTSPQNNTGDIGAWEFNQGGISWTLVNGAKYALGFTGFDENALLISYSEGSTEKNFAISKNELINDDNVINGGFKIPTILDPTDKYWLMANSGELTFVNGGESYSLWVDPTTGEMSVQHVNVNSEGIAELIKEYNYSPNKVKHNISLKSRVTPNAHEIDVNFSFYTEQSVQSIQGLRDLIDVYSGRNTCSGFFMDTDMYLAIDIYKENNTLYVDGRQIMLSGTQIVADEHITYNITESSDVTFTDVVETI